VDRGHRRSDQPTPDVHGGGGQLAGGPRPASGILVQELVHDILHGGGDLVGQRRHIVSDMATATAIVSAPAKGVRPARHK